MRPTKKNTEDLSFRSYLHTHSTQPFNIIGQILLARYEKIDNEIIESKLQEGKFDTEQHDFILRWVQKKLRLLGHQGKDNLSM